MHQWDDTKNCMSHSWYLAIDMQFFIISPFIIFTMWKFPKVGSIFAGLLTLAGKSQMSKSSLMDTVSSNCCSPDSLLDQGVSCLSHV